MRCWAVLALCALPVAAAAQTDDRDYLTAFLEDNLSGAGRAVTITGFSGALSSTAAIERLTIADDVGIWITLTGVTLDWSRSALFSGALSVSELSADTIIITRAPNTDGDGPTPEATVFALPDLPVSVAIDRIAADEITLGPDLLGQLVTGRLEASAQLANGQGQATLVLERTDGTLGTLSLTGEYANDTGALTLDMRADEAAGGLAATLLGLPGAPSVQVSILGTGTLDDFTADLDLRTDGISRLAGAVTLGQTADRTQIFTATLNGNPAPLFLPAYAAFFGDDVSLRMVGARSPEGAIAVTALQVDTRALALNGDLTLAPDGLPQNINLTGLLADPTGLPVLLPFPDGPETRVDRATLTIGFDAARRADWRANFILDGLATPDFAAEALTLTGTGQIARTADGNRFDAAFAYAATGLAPRDTALATALGPGIAGNATLNWQSGIDALQIPGLTVTGEGFDISANAAIAGLSTGLSTTGRISVSAADFARYALLADMPLSGSGNANVNGTYTPLGGAFDGTIAFSGRDLAVGVPEVDNLLRGPSRLTADLKRDEAGLAIRDLRLTAQTLTARASGRLASDRTAIEADLNFADLSVLGPSYTGQLQAKATLQGPLDTAAFTLQGTGQALGIGTPAVDNLLAGNSDIILRGARRDGGIDLGTLALTAQNLRATIAGRVDTTAGHLLSGTLQFPNLSALGPPYSGALTAEVGFAGTPDAGQITLDGSATNMGVGQPEVNRILAGRSTVSAVLRMDNGLIQIDRARVDNPQITASATGTVNGSARNVDVTARLANLGLILPDFPGAVTVAGDVTQSTTAITLNLRGTGPGGINATITGTLSPDYRRANLAIAGQAQAGLANVVIDPGTLSGNLGFDLALNGPVAVSSLSGRTTLSGGRYASPDLPFALTDLNGTATLAGGRATVAADAALSTGGRLQVGGTVNAAAPFNADLTATLANVTLRDASLFQTRGNGTITVQGPLAGGAQFAGRLALTETEIRVPNGSFTGAGTLPDLVHVNESTASRQTRLFAGLIAGASADGTGGNDGGPARAYPLDLEISAPNRLFVRGRGLDAELGGSLRLRGTTADVIPDGAFSLIRGRLDILGKRLTLSEAELRLSGNFEPELRILASNESDGITSSVMVQGNANDPQVSFASNPELPEEEVLSRLLFGRALNTLSAFQAAQLAGAVATLAGRGGEGLLAKLRKGFGLDDLDISTTDAGETSLTAGKYISENTYTEIEVDQQGRSTITLNLDVNEKLTVRGSLSTDGQTGIGVFLEKDY